MIKRSSMTLYSRSDLFCHRTRFVLAEKGVTSDIIHLDYQEEPLEDFLQINPSGSVPTLVDRELILTQSGVIMEYLDERFPHPPLLPVYPVHRAKHRLMMHHIEQDWYAPLLNIMRSDDAELVSAEREVSKTDSPVSCHCLKKVTFLWVMIFLWSIVVLRCFYGVYRIMASPLPTTFSSVWMSMPTVFLIVKHSKHH